MIANGTNQIGDTVRSDSEIKADVEALRRDAVIDPSGME